MPESDYPHPGEIGDLVGKGQLAPIYRFVLPGAMRWSLKAMLLHMPVLGWTAERGRQ